MLTREIARREMAALLHPEAAIDRGIGKLSPEAAVAFFMILAAVNSHGKMDGDLFVLKGRCFRHIDYITMANLPGILRELSQHTSVKWWTDPEGNSWIHVKNYAKWNTGLRKDRMGKDKLPSWPGDETEKAGEVEGEVEEGSLSISRRVVPAIAVTTPGVLPEQTKNGNEEKRRSKPKPLVYSPEFEQFWTRYPRKVAKLNAYREWTKLDPKPDIEVVLAGLERAKKSRQWEDPKYIPYPERWLKARRWEDEVEPPKECPYQNFNDPNYHMPGDPEWTTQSKLQK
jgi:hypothetical protein